MADRREILTDKLIARLPFAQEKQFKVRDTELPGFFLLVGKARKSFLVQGEYWRNGVREFAAQIKVGEFDDLTTREARRKAREVLGSVARGQRPGETRTGGRAGPITLRQAWDRYRDAHMIRKARSPGTIANYQDHMDRLFEDWLDKPLARLGRDPKLVLDRHEKITKENGPYIANGSMRSLRAIYNHARKSNPDLPVVNPVTAIDWNREQRRNTGMGLQDTGQWLIELFGLTNPVRREFHLLTLLSGSRPTALKGVRIKDIDLQRRVIHIPSPKGGEKRAFDIPLSRAMILCIIRAIRIGRISHPEQARTWLFPADSETGHLEEHKEDRRVLSKWGNDLRQTYRTLAQAAGVSELDVHLLMNHSLPGVNAGYITRDQLLRDHLRKQQQRIAALIMNAVSRSSQHRTHGWLHNARTKCGMATAELRLAA